MRLPWSYLLAALVAAAAIAPLTVLVSMAGDLSQIFTTQNIDVLSNTALLVLITVMASVLIGVPLAFVTAYVQLPMPGLWFALLASPLAIPSYIGAFTLYAASGSSGEIHQLFGFTLPTLEGLFGASLVMTLYSYPYIMLTTRAALRGLDGNLVNAARTLGLSLPMCLWRIVLPRALPGIAAGCLLVALYTLSDFGTPAMMRFDTFTRVIFIEYNAFGLDQAALLSLQLVLVVGVVLLFESIVKSTPEKVGVGLQLWLKPWQLVSLAAVIAVLLLLAVGVPLGVLLVWFAREGTEGFKLSYAWNSSYGALLAAFVCVLVALPVAHAALKGRFGKLLERITYIGFGIPGIVMGTALVYLGLQVSFLYQSMALLIFAYVLRFLPLAVGAVRTTLASIDASYVKAAKLLGANSGEAFRRITLPLTARGMVAGLSLVFLEAMRELPATLMLGPTGFETLATYLWRVYEAGYFGRAAAPSALLIAISVLGLTAVIIGERRADVA